MFMFDFGARKKPCPKGKRRHPVTKRCRTVKKRKTPVRHYRRRSLSGLPDDMPAYQWRKTTTLITNGLRKELQKCCRYNGHLPSWVYSLRNVPSPDRISKMFTYHR